MSKGIGQLQRDILARLDSPGREVEKGLFVNGTEVEEGVYDLRLVARYVAGGEAARLFGFPAYPTSSFSAAFSRAVRSLIERGELEVVSLPLRDGRPTRQIRFVRLRSKVPERPFGGVRIDSD